MSLSLKPWLLANSMAGSSQNLASFSAFITWICLRSSSLEYILKTYPFFFKFRTHWPQSFVCEDKNNQSKKQIIGNKNVWIGKI